MNSMNAVGVRLPLLPPKAVNLGETLNILTF